MDKKFQGFDKNELKNFFFSRYPSQGISPSIYMPQSRIQQKQSNQEQKDRNKSYSEGKSVLSKNLNQQRSIKPFSSKQQPTGTHIDMNSRIMKNEVESSFEEKKVIQLKQLILQEQIMKTMKNREEQQTLMEINKNKITQLYDDKQKQIVEKYQQQTYEAIENNKNKQQKIIEERNKQLEATFDSLKQHLQKIKKETELTIREQEEKMRIQEQQYIISKEKRIKKISSQQQRIEKQTQEIKQKYENQKLEVTSKLKIDIEKIKSDLSKILVNLNQKRQEELASLQDEEELLLRKQIQKFQEMNYSLSAQIIELETDQQQLKKEKQKINQKLNILSTKNNKRIEEFLKSSKEKKQTSRPKNLIIQTTDLVKKMVKKNQN